MSYRNSSTTLSIIDQQNLVRAIVALQQQQKSQVRRRTPLKENTSPTLAQNAPRAGSSRSSRLSRKAHQPWQQKIVSLPDAQNDSQRNINLDDDLSISTNTSVQEAPEHPPTLANLSKDGDPLQIPSRPSPSQVKTTPNPSSDTMKSDSTYLRLFLVKPEVRERYETIELSWSDVDAHLQQSDIREQLALYKRENLPPVLDILETLEAYERLTIEDLIPRNDIYSSRPKYELLALKRTRTDISYGGMLFQGVPELRFVIQQMESQHLSPPSPPVSIINRPTKSIRMRERLFEDDDSDTSAHRLSNTRAARGWAPYIREKRPRFNAQIDETAEEEDEQEEDGEAEVKDDSIAGVDEEQMVKELLGKYTTLYE